MNNRFIAIEGLDGSGKSTQIALLIKYFESKNLPVRFIHFPRHNEGVFGELISRFLRGEFGSVDAVHPQLVALLFAEDRKDFAVTIRQWLEEGCFVLVDRYVYSNIAFQCAKLKAWEEKEQLARWIKNFEFEYNKIPMPDLSLYLQASFQFTKRSLEIRSASKDRDYLKGADDIHEQDFSLQQAVKEEYERLLLTEHLLKPIICHNADGGMRSIADIHSDIVAMIGV